MDAEFCNFDYNKYNYSEDTNTLRLLHEIHQVIKTHYPSLRVLPVDLQKFGMKGELVVQIKGFNRKVKIYKFL